MMDFAGHRARLMEKFLNYNNLNKRELIELLLFFSLPRKDVKTLSKAIENRFSTLEAMFANAESLNDLKGIGKKTICFFKLFYSVSLKMMEEKIYHESYINCFDELIEYCQLKIGHCTRENGLVIFLNKNNKIIKNEIIARGTINYVDIPPREILKMSLNCGATSVIVCHNHPSGDCTPSPEDILFTKNLKKILCNLKIELIDHLVISQNNFVSMKQSNFF